MTAIEDVYELSPVQQGMLFHALLRPDSDVYRVVLLYSIRGALKPELFVQSWQHVVREHSALRTTYHWTGLEKPLQVVHSEAVLPFDIINASVLAPEQRAAQWDALVAEARETPLPLDRAPLLRAKLLRYDADSYRFIFTCHHLLLDGWSAAFLVERACKVYAALARCESIPTQATGPFREYIAWLQRQDRSAAETFWRRELAGLSGPTPLGIPRPAATNSVWRHAVERTALPSIPLRQAAARRGLTMNTLVQGVWALLLGRYSGQRDVLFGATISGRPVDLKGVESMVGLFINTVPVRVIVEGSRVDDWLAALQIHQAEARRHGHISLAEVHGWTEVPRDVPLFDTLLVFENFPARRALAQAQLHDIEMTRIGVLQQTNYPVTVCVEEEDADLRVAILYDAGRFDASSIRTMAEHYRTALEQLSGSLQRRVDDISVLTRDERRRLLVEWNDTTVKYASSCLHELFEAQVAERPDELAVIHSRARLTYRQLNERANRLGHHLRALGVGPEVPVAICIERSPDMLAALLAVLKAGGCYVPLDATYPTERLAFMVADSEASLLLTRPGWMREPLPLRTAFIDHPEIDLLPCDNLPPAAAAHNLSYVLFTSGSTGIPKAVAIEHHSAVNVACWARNTFAGDLACVLASTSICFDCSIFELFAPLASGGAVMLVDNLLELATLPAADDVTLVNSVPSGMAALLRIARLPPSVRTVNVGGEPPEPRLVDALYSHPGVRRVVNGYGPTECTTYSTYSVLHRSHSGRISIGRPIANTTLYILDERGAPVPIGVTGELYVGGEGVARGYLGREDLTRQKFIPDRFASRRGARMYRTGDLVRYALDGTVEFLGRTDDQVKVRGFRVELGEVEAALQRHASVERAAVVMHEGATGERSLVAYVTGRALEPAQLRSWLREMLPPPLLPSRIEILDALPLLPNGKVDRRALPAPTEAPRDAGAEAAGDALELQLVAVWEEILRVTPVGVNDDFFDLGGHSLLAVRLMARLQKLFGRTLPLATVLSAPTIRELAGVLRAGRPSGSSLLVTIRAAGGKCPLFLLPPSDGGVLGYAELARHLDRDRPIHALQAPGVDGETAPLRGIEEMASVYLAAVTKMQQRGPYLLAGWSLGGIVAFEMAQRLRREGRQVAGLALLDAWAPDPSRPPPALDESRLMAALPRETGPWLRDLLARVREMPGTDERQRFEAALRQTTIPDGHHQAVAQIKWIAHVYQAGMEALRHYRALPYAGELLLVRAAERLSTSPPDPTLGWGDLASVTTTVVPGNHYTMMREPQIKWVSQDLIEYFERCP